MTIENIVLVTGGTLTGLLAGVFYAFSVAIVPALRLLKPKEHIAAMQYINSKIQNPIFFLSFFGPTLVLPLAAFLLRESAQFPLLVIAALLHIFGSNGVTVVGNIPLNDKLDKVDINQISDAEAEAIRQEHQGAGSAWMRWHHVRTVAAIIATALLFIACFGRNAA